MDVNDTHDPEDTNSEHSIRFTDTAITNLNDLSDSEDTNSNGNDGLNDSNNLFDLDDLEGTNSEHSINLSDLEGTNSAHSINLENKIKKVNDLSDSEDTSSNGNDELNYPSNLLYLNDLTEFNNATSLTANNSAYTQTINLLLSKILEATNKGDRDEVGFYIDTLLISNNLILLKGLLLHEDFYNNNVNLQIALDKISKTLEEKQKHSKNSMSNDKNNDNNTNNPLMDNDIQFLRELQNILRNINTSTQNHDIATSSNHNHRPHNI